MTDSPSQARAAHPRPPGTQPELPIPPAWTGYVPEGDSGFLRANDALPRRRRVRLVVLPVLGVVALLLLVRPRPARRRARPQPPPGRGRRHRPGGGPGRPVHCRRAAGGLVPLRTRGAAAVRHPGSLAGRDPGDPAAGRPGPAGRRGGRGHARRRRLGRRGHHLRGDAGTAAPAARRRPGREYVRPGRRPARRGPDRARPQHRGRAGRGRTRRRLHPGHEPGRGRPDGRGPPAAGRPPGHRPGRARGCRGRAGPVRDPGPGRGRRARAGDRRLRPQRRDVAARPHARPPRPGAAVVPSRGRRQGPAGDRVRPSRPGRPVRGLVPRRVRARRRRDRVRDRPEGARLHHRAVRAGPAPGRALDAHPRRHPHRARSRHRGVPDAGAALLTVTARGPDRGRVDITEGRQPSRAVLVSPGADVPRSALVPVLGGTGLSIGAEHDTAVRVDTVGVYLAH